MGVKFAILEQGGVELDVNTEREAIAEDIFYSDAKLETVKEVLDKLLAFTIIEEYSSDTNQSTTSNNWVVKSGFPYTTSDLPAGNYEISFSAEIGQSKKKKVVGSIFEWRDGITGDWVPLSDIRNGLSISNAYELRSGFRKIIKTVTGVVQLRASWGQTDDGGTGYMRNVTMRMQRIGDVGNI